jgi:hypothetical protein
LIVAQEQNWHVHKVSSPLSATKCQPQRFLCQRSNRSHIISRHICICSKYHSTRQLSFVHRLRHTRNSFLGRSKEQRLSNGTMLQSPDLSPRLHLLCGEQPMAFPTLQLALEVEFAMCAIPFRGIAALGSARSGFVRGVENRAATRASKKH